jgi:hypothetical protein
LIAGGALTGVFIAILAVLTPGIIEAVNLEHSMTGIFGAAGYQILAVLFFAAMMVMLYRLATRKD